LLIHSKIGATMSSQAIHLYETSAVQENIETFPRQEFALFVLTSGALFTSTRLCFLVQLSELVEIIACDHEENFLDTRSKRSPWERVAAS